MDLEQKIKEITNQTSDINEHIPTLVKYANECDHITEMGVRGILSTWAFIAGKPNELRSYDIQHPSKFGGKIEDVHKVCSDNMIDFKFIQANVLDVKIDYTDLLFIDTWHAHKQLIAELKLHSPYVKKYIILHDTTTFANRDETSYEHWGEDFKAEGIGLWKAVEDFLDDNPEWFIKERFTNNNGLSILERRH